MMNAVFILPFLVGTESVPSECKQTMQKAKFSL